MKNRIIQIIKTENITKTEFAKRIEVSQAFVSQMCSGAYSPSARTISAICREFHISRQWLETGEGPMKLPEVDMDLEIINDLLADLDDPVAAGIRSVWKLYRAMPPEDQQVLRNFMRSLLDQK